MKWIDKVREIRDSLPDTSESNAAFTTTQLVTPHEARGYLEKNIYGFPHDARKVLSLKEKISVGSLGEAEDVIAVDTKGALISGIALLLAIVETGTPAVQIVSTNAIWEFDPSDFSIIWTSWAV